MHEAIVRWIQCSVLICTSALSLQAHADNTAPVFPNRPIKVFIGYPPGGGGDAVLRPLVQRLGVQLGTNVVIDYRPGANGALAAAATQQALPDGYTLFFTDSSFFSTPRPSEQGGPDLRSFSPISTVAFFSFALVVNNNFPANTLSEFLSLVQADPDKYSYGSPGIGSTGHKIAEALQKSARMQMYHVPYKGGPQMLTDLLSGQIDASILSLPFVMPYVNARQIKMLAVTSRERGKLFPLVPALSEALPNFQGGSNAFLLAPPKTPAHIVDKLNKAVHAAMSMPEARSEFAVKGIDVHLSSVRELANLMQEEALGWPAEAAIKPTTLKH